MPFTATHLANAGLEKLQKGGGLGNAPDAEDTQKMLAFVPRLAKTLSSQDIYTIADLNDIDEDAFDWLALYLAYLAAMDFACPQDVGMRLTAEYHLRLLNTPKPTGEVLRTEYY